jgi:hypothetical protein
MTEEGAGGREEFFLTGKVYGRWNIKTMLSPNWKLK